MIHGKAAAGPPFLSVVVPAAGRQPDDAWRVHEVAGQRPVLPLRLQSSIMANCCDERGNAAMRMGRCGARPSSIRAAAPAP
ncbi:hypothetical protein FEO84_14175 [Stenotrophomonas maltophilia]|nr:hypothetical protein FEO84_14175 [Stenotrophomonas maltophilia]REC84009.1 hypothetical protein DXK52_09090 [Stenotrophomonas maltophilia]HEP1209058.1 hypothetical protein [Stenotrophomonas maltophilia]